MPRNHLLFIVGATAMTLAAVYAPQPLLPVIARSMDITKTQAASLISWSLLPMGLAPLAAGLLMQRVAPHRLIAWCLLLLALGEGLFTVAPTFELMAVVRFAQGILVAMFLPAMMTFIALTAGSRLRQIMSIYVASSVIGGLIGRLLAGFIATVFDWRWGFAVITVGLVICAIAAFQLQSDKQAPAKSIKLKRLFSVLRWPVLPPLLAMIFCAFFVFTALLNFVPFRIDQLDNSLGEAVIALSYTGFLLGMGASLLSGRIVKRLGGDFQTLGAALVVLTGAQILLSVPGVLWVVGAIAVAAIGFFLTHAVLSTFLNAQAGVDAEAVNSMYMAVYYLGGTLGSLLPGFVYEQFGWQLVIWMQLTVLGVAGFMLLLAVRYSRHAALSVQEITQVRD